ncbi:hypothetical protein POM88_012373 [Heracleum sosnowskyi]|uniref:Uncharacterized protein n=1 Tax=Heracleum sosnowskyi TaxID=360622 RepID=A0AAD8N2F3_9APIA|nr:hypothetical protein POM88_012373 [Heracleum sosnowskyi]
MIQLSSSPLTKQKPNLTRDDWRVTAAQLLCAKLNSEVYMLKLIQEMDSKNKKKKKVQRIEVIPENAPYVEDSHIIVGSFADESLSEEDIEQEELSQLSTKRKRVGNDVDSNEPEMEKDEHVPEKCDKPYQRKPRKKISFV